ENSSSLQPFWVRKGVRPGTSIASDNAARPQMFRVVGWFSQCFLRRRLFLHEPINPLAVERAAQQVDLAFFVLAEGEHRFAAVLDRPVGDDAALRFVVTQGPE